MSDSSNGIGATAWPDVDVVMPIRNEAEHLDAAIAAVREQEYPGTVRIFLGVGPSHDGTERLAASIAAHDDGVVVVVDNPSGLIPSALNRAVRAGSAPVVVRVDGHSALSAGYIRRAVTTMRRTGAVNVGGIQSPVATSALTGAVAAVTTSWLGTGGASYRIGGEEGPVDTVFVGVFDRAALEAVGLYDESLLRNEDYELNIRLRDAGGTVWFDPELTVDYHPRATWGSLARQYFDYGYWKVVVLGMHPHSARARQIVPPLAIGTVVAGLVVATRWRPAAIAPIGYVATVVATAARFRRPVAVRALGCLVAPVIHGAWSAGFAVSALRRWVGGRDA